MELGIYHSTTEMLYDAVYLLARSYDLDNGLPQPVKRVPRLDLKGSLRQVADLLEAIE